MPSKKASKIFVATLLLALIIDKDEATTRNESIRDVGIFCFFIYFIKIVPSCRNASIRDVGIFVFSHLFYDN